MLYEAQLYKIRTRPLPKNTIIDILLVIIESSVMDQRLERVDSAVIKLFRKIFCYDETAYSSSGFRSDFLF